MLAADLMLLALGWTFSIWLPINKGLWTSSYAIFMAGWALVCFGILYWLVDVKGYERWVKPFAIFGRNAIAAYVLSMTRWGRHVYAIGDDAEAARLAGVQVRRMLFSVYAVAGLV